jgi:hypothetical protein
MKMYYDDFDNNGSFETIVDRKRASIILLWLDELADQFSGSIKRFNFYKSFAGKTL